MPNRAEVTLEIQTTNHKWLGGREDTAKTVGATTRLLPDRNLLLGSLTQWPME